MSAEASPPTLDALSPAQARWRCPNAWVRASFHHDDPPLLWGQTRLQDALDALAGAIRAGRTLHLDVPSAGTGGEGAALAEGLRRRLEGAPVVEALHPSLVRLRGTADAPGLLAEAHGGVLILDARDLDLPVAAVLREAMVHQRIAPAGDSLPPARPRPARVCVVLFGPDGARRVVREADGTWDGLWAERVGLEPDLPRTREGVGIVAARLRSEGAGAGTAEERGPTATAGALAYLIEELAGRPARRERVAVDLDRAVRALQEARRPRDGRASAAAVRAAWAAQQERGAAGEAAHRARVAGGQVRLQTTGTALGVVNGLMVYGGQAAYCIPGRITARVAVGREGVLNVERESKYSGRSFDKGVFQLAAWLRGEFAGGAYPLGVVASLAFEQSYSKVDGDSATLAETIALLSELSGLPVRQDLAMTGALNQRGELLTVGSVSLKVRGWWETCRTLGGLTGTQGVVLPRLSAPDLQLDAELVADLARGRFHVWLADGVADVAAFALGRAAGSPRDEASADTVFGLAGARLRAMSERLYPGRRVAPEKPGPSKQLEAPEAPEEGKSANDRGSDPP